MTFHGEWLGHTLTKSTQLLTRWTRHCALCSSFQGVALTASVSFRYVSSKKNLDKLSALGHFLKGSSAALGFQKVQASCELIQHLGHKHDSETGKDITSEVALGKIGPLLVRVKVDYSEAEKWLKNWFAENAGGDYPPED